MFIRSAGLAGAVLAAPLPGLGADERLPALRRPEAPPERVASDEGYWGRVAAHYRVSNRMTNLEAGYWGVMATPVVADYTRHVERVNTESSFYARGAYLTDVEAVRARVAATLGVELNEVAFTRGATEALQCLISGYNRLKPGDAVMYADVDRLAAALKPLSLENR
jgi:hypothetical protein